MADPLRAGIEAALARGRETGFLMHDLEVAAEQYVYDAVKTSDSLLDGSEDPRFAALFAELVSIAAIARVAYDEEPLGRDAIARFLEVSKSIFNSWVHRDEDRYR